MTLGIDREGGKTQEKQRVNNSFDSLLGQWVSSHNHLSRGVTYSSSCQGKQDCRTRDGICRWEAQHLGSSPGGRSSQGTCQPLEAPSRKDEEEDLVAKSLVQNHQLLTPLWQQELVFTIWPSLPLLIQVFFSEFFVTAGRVTMLSLLLTTFATIPPFIGKEGGLFSAWWVVMRCPFSNCSLLRAAEGGS